MIGAPFLRRSRDAISGRDFGLFLFGYTLAGIGSQTVVVALPFALFRIGDGAAQVGEVLTARSIPLVILLLVGGVVADRFPRRLVMIGADVLRAVSELLVAALLLIGHGTVVALAALSVLNGVGDAFFLPGRSGLVPELVEPPRLQAANSLVSMAQSTGNIVGPALGGLLVGFTGPGWAFGVGGLTYSISAVCLLLIRSRPKAGAAQTSPLRQLLDGWDAFRSRLWLWASVLQFTLFHLLTFGPLLVLGPLRYRGVPGGAAEWGELLTASGLGAVAGGLFSLRLKPKLPLRTALLAFLLYALAPAAMAFSAPFVARLTAFFAAGVGVQIFSILWTTTMQREIEPDMLARVTAYDAMGSVCLLPLGYAIAAPMAEEFGVGGALWIAAAYSFISTIVVLTPRRIRDLPARPARLLEGASRSDDAIVV